MNKTGFTENDILMNLSKGIENVKTDLGLKNSSSVNLEERNPFFNSIRDDIKIEGNVENIEQENNAGIGVGMSRVRDEGNGIHVSSQEYNQSSIFNNLGASLILIVAFVIALIFLVSFATFIILKNINL